ncbi:MAG: hypothetical protein HRT47_00300 [Candidatus Caenarcaniphilales bacterium]|nr:hypothetical protein [Candidatus Caenarcaniphilales bacterium]
MVENVNSIRTESTSGQSGVDLNKLAMTGLSGFIQNGGISNTISQPARQRMQEALDASSAAEPDNSKLEALQDEFNRQQTNEADKITDTNSFKKLLEKFMRSLNIQAEEPSSKPGEEYSSNTGTGETVVTQDPIAQSRETNTTWENNS